MRKVTLIAAAFAVAISANSLYGGVASAQSMPAGVHVANGALADASGKALYTFNFDTMVGMSHCEGPCEKAWPPLIASAGAKASGDWSIISRGAGVNQWAYKDKPLYTYAKDTAGQPGKGEVAGGNWKLAH